jgi:dCMP deaminase
MIGEIKRTPLQWDSFYFEMAHLVRTLSKDPKRQVGAVLVTPDRRQLSIGYNGFPAEMPDLKEHLKDQDFKRKHMVHAEDNCLKQAPFSTKGCTLYVTSFPCDGCAEKIARAEVARVVAPTPDFQHPFWGESYKRALKGLSDGGCLVAMVTTEDTTQ